MKNLLLTIAISIVCSCYAFAQDEYPQGIYMSIEDIISKTPSMKDSAQIVLRTEYDINANGGNDYKAISPDKKTKKLLKKKAWAYSDGDSLFLNGKKFHVQRGYTKLLNDGRFLIFYAAMTDKRAAFNNAAYIASGIALGLFAGFYFVPTGPGSKFLYAYDTTTKELHTITIDFLDRTLPEISMEAYSSFKEDVDTMKKAKRHDKAYLKNLIISKYTPVLNYSHKENHYQYNL